MDKLKMHSPDGVAGNVEKLMATFPHCVVEAWDEDGKLCRKVDWDLLQQELANTLVEGNQERYTLSWPGKREAMLLANSPVAKTLRPCREESVDFDNTKNLYIEGDNLDVLKLLQENYLGKVKMIYIDPPYNTGNDFVYEDDFSEDSESYLMKSNQKDEQGNRLIANTESNGRFHSDWLTMMYPRLKLARSLLTDDGVIFISIDDNEVHNLRKLCDEILGEDNFIANFIWKRRVSSSLADNNVSTDHDYVLCYKKEQISGFAGIEKDFKNYSNPDNDPRGPWIADNLTVGMNAAMRPNQAYDLVDPKTGNVFPFNPNRVWSYIPESMQRLIAESRIIFPADKSKRPMLKRYQNELKTAYNPISSLLLDKVGLNTEATRTIQDVMTGNIFEFSKPLSLLKTLIPQICSENDVILDFFSGSATTAQAVIQLNADDNSNRRFIMVQLPEACDEKSAAYKAGYKNICEIGKERIRRAGKKVLESLTAKNEKDKKSADLFSADKEERALDIGFRVLKLDSSNMEDVYYTPDKLRQDELGFAESNIKDDRSPEDLLFQVMLDWGLDLALPITVEDIQSKKVFFVDGNALAACFDDNVTESVVKAIAARKPLRAVFRDSSFATDSTKINVEEIFKLLSPTTDVKAI